MATLLQNIKEELLTARKARCQSIPRILTPVIGDLQTAYKAKTRGFDFDNMPDDAVIEIIKAHIKGAKDTLVLDENNTEAMETLKVLSEYMRKLFTEEEVMAVISEFIKSDEYESLGSLMKFMRTTHPNRYDARLVKEIHDNIA